MKILVKSLQGDEYFVEVKNDQSVFDLKVKISEEPNGPAVCRQKLIFKGITMQESSKIGDYNLVDGSKVHLIVKKSENISQRTSNETFSNVPTASVPKLTSYLPQQCLMSTAKGGVRNTNSNYSNDNFQSGTIKCVSQLHKAESPPASLRSANDEQSQATNRFEVILRERLAKHFDADAVEKIMANIKHEIDADIDSTSLDDLEQMAKQKLNITNE